MRWGEWLLAVLIIVLFAIMFRAGMKESRAPATITLYDAYKGRYYRYSCDHLWFTEEAGAPTAHCTKGKFTVSYWGLVPYTVVVEK